MAKNDRYNEIATRWYNYGWRVYTDAILGRGYIHIETEKFITLRAAHGYAMKNQIPHHKKGKSNE